MKKYKRLTTKKIDLDKLSDKAKSKISDTYLDYAKMNNALWELENKIENGTMIELPCKVGDTVYIPYKFRNKSGVFETIIEEIRIEEKHISFWAKPLYTNNSIRVKYLGWKKLKDFNKTWFLSKAKAEKKLKELKEKENGEIV